MPADVDTVGFGSFRFDLRNGLLFRNGREVPLPPRALGVLALLVRRSGQVVTKQELLDAVWKGVIVEEASLKEAISSLRQILGDDPRQPVYIQTIHRRGYRFLATPDVAVSPTEASSGQSSGSGGRGSVPRRRVAPVMAAVLIAGALIGCAWWWHLRARSQPVGAVLRFTISPPGGDTLANMDTPIVAMARDGSRFAFVTRHGDTTLLYLRRLDRPAPMLIAGSAGAEAPFFSPDGRWLGFCADGMLKIVQIGRGAPISLTPLRDCEGASWGRAGSIVFGSESGLWSIAASGGTPTPLTRVNAADGEVGHWWPDILPDGAIVFTVWKSVLNDAQLAILRPGARTYRIIYKGGSDPHYLPGRLVVAEESGAATLPFDLSSGTIRGAPLAADGHVAVETFMGVAQIAVAANGSRVSFAGSGRAYSASLDWADAAGRITPSGLPTRAYGDAALSRNGKWLAATINGAHSHDVWVGNLKRGSLIRLTAHGLNSDPIWSPNGRWVTYASTLRGQVSIWRRRADGSGAPHLLMAGTEPRWPNSYSPDGSRLAYTFSTSSQGDSLGILELEGRRGAVSLADAPGNQTDAQISPDGRWLAYLSDASGRFPGDYQVFLRALPRPGPAWPISIGSGEDPFWAPNGRILYYQDGNVIWAVSLGFSTVPVKPVIGTPRKLFVMPGVQLCGVSPDGKHLLLIVPKHPGHPSNRILVEVHA